MIRNLIDYSEYRTQRSNFEFWDRLRNKREWKKFQHSSIAIITAKVRDTPISYRLYNLARINISAFLQKSENMDFRYLFQTPLFQILYQASLF
jgi:hypothetical protein